MTNLFQCDGNYICIGIFVEFILTLFMLFVMFDGWRYVRNERKQIQDIDRFMYHCSFLCTILQVLYTLILDYDLTLTTVRCIGLLIQILICNILSLIISDDSDKAIGWTITKVLIGVISFEWFWSGIIHHSYISYNCVYSDYIILSITGLILALIAAALGYEALSGIGACIDALGVRINKEFERKDNIAKQLDQATQNYHKVLVLAVSGVIQFGLQSCWDLIAHYQTEVASDCIYYYYGTSQLILCVLLAILRFFSLFTIHLAVYYAFYYKNKEYFTQSQVNSDVYLEMS